MEHSVLSLQVSKKPSHAGTRKFYMKLGFICNDPSDEGANGIHHTPQAFQHLVEAFPDLWISHQRESMFLFQLLKGDFKIGHEQALLGLPSEGIERGKDGVMCWSWERYIYLRFPDQFPSMK
jgi:hypothetical protein